MKPIRLDQDVRPLSEFRAGMSQFIQQVAETRRPLLLTQNGRGVAVLLDVREFEDLQERLELYLTLVRSYDDIIEGRVVSHDEAIQWIREELEKLDESQE